MSHSGRKRKKPEGLSEIGATVHQQFNLNSRLSELVEKANQESLKKEMTRDDFHTTESIKIRLNTMSEALQFIQRPEISPKNRKDVADQSWNLVWDYFETIAASKYTPSDLQILLRAANYCKAFYPNLTEDDEEKLDAWIAKIQRKLQVDHKSESTGRQTTTHSSTLSTTGRSQRTIKPSSKFKLFKDPDLESQTKKQKTAADKEVKVSQKQIKKKLKVKTKADESAATQEKDQKDKLEPVRVLFTTMTTGPNLYADDVENFFKLIKRKVPQDLRDELEDYVFKLYEHILRLKYNKYHFTGNYKNVLQRLQNFLIKIPVEKQLPQFKQLTEKLKLKQSPLVSEKEDKESKIDVNITLPTEAMLMHPSHVNFTNNAFNTTGDSSLRLMHGMKGVEKVIDRGELNYKLVTVGKKTDAEFPSQDSKEKDRKIDKDQPLSLQMLSELSEELEMSLLADKHGDIFVNSHTPQAVLDSAELARNSVVQSKATKTPSVAVLRPPGHHAGETDIKQLSDIKKAEGFCFINNVFVAAETAAGLGAKNILIIDFDTHDGNGTKKLLTRNWDRDSNIYFVNTYSQHLYPHQNSAEKPHSDSKIKTPSHDNQVRIFDCPFPKGKKPAGDQNVLNVIEQCLKELKSQKIDTVLISCGLDAHQDDKLGQGEGTGIALTDEFYKNILAKVQTYFPGASLSIFLEGGYNVKVIERTFENILNHLVKQRKLTEQQSVLPYSVFASEPAHQGESSDSHHNHRKNGR